MSVVGNPMVQPGLVYCLGKCPETNKMGRMLELCVVCVQGFFTGIYYCPV